eukprot:7951612-Alexandrium_andersonii.AAC.1
MSLLTLSHKASRRSLQSFMAQWVANRGSRSLGDKLKQAKLSWLSGPVVARQRCIMLGAVPKHNLAIAPKQQRGACLHACMRGCVAPVAPLSSSGPEPRRQIKPSLPYECVHMCVCAQTHNRM